MVQRVEIFSFHVKQALMPKRTSSKPLPWEVLVFRMHHRTCRKGKMSLVLKCVVGIDLVTSIVRYPPTRDQ